MKKRIFIITLLLFSILFLYVNSASAQLSYIYPRIEEVDGDPAGIMVKIIFPNDSLTQSGFDWTTSFNNAGGWVLDPNTNTATRWGDIRIIDPNDLGSESLAETDFATHAKWDVAGDFDDSGGNAVYTHSTGAGTLTQTSANMDNAGIGGQWYKFGYTISDADAGCTAEITTAFAETAVDLELADGNYVIYFRSAGTPTDFVISATSAAVSDGFTIDDVSLKQVTGGDISIAGDLLISGDINWLGGNVTYVPIDGDIQTYVTNANSGDTLVLASGVYTITSTITVNKQLNIVGQGRSGFITTPVTPSHGTLVESSTSSVTAFAITNDNARIANLSLSMTGTSTLGVSVANNLQGIVFNDMDVIVNNGGTHQAFLIKGSNVVMRDVTFYVTSLDNTAAGVYFWNDSTTTQDAVLDCFNVTGTVVGGATYAYAFACFNTNDDNTLTMNLSNSVCKTLSGTVLDIAVASTSVTTNNSIVNAYMCTFDGADYDAYQTGSNVLALGGSVLENNLIFGTPTYRATMVAGTVQTPTINGGILANEDITIQGTTHATKTTSYVNLQPTGGYVGINKIVPVAKLDIESPTPSDILIRGYGDSNHTADFINAGAGSIEKFVVEADGDVVSAGTVEANGAVLTGASNTFNITSGTSSLDVAAGKTVNIDMDLTIDGTGTTITGAGQANTITLNESLTIGDGANMTLTAEDTAGSMTLDKQTFEVEGEGTATQLTKIVNANNAAATLTIEGTSSVVNQDTTSDATVTFGTVNGLTITDTANTIDIDKGTAGLDIAPAATVNIDQSLTVDGQAVTITGADQANTITLNESITVGGGNSGTITYSASGKTLTVEDSATVGLDVNALEGLSSTGLVARTVANTYSERTITGDANEITVTNGDGVSGNPSLSIDLNRDIVAGTGLTGGADDSLVGADGDVTLAVDGVLEDLDTLGAAASDGQFIVATGAGAFAYESTTTARTSLGIGTGDSPSFTGATLTGGALSVGVDDTTDAIVNLYGDNADTGPTVILHNSANEDTTEEYWVMEPQGTNFWFGAVSDTDQFIFSNAGNFTASGNVAGATYADDASVSNAELKYINTLSSNAQDQLDARCLESVFGTAIGTGLLLDGTTLKTSLGLQSIAGLTETNGGIPYGTADNTYAWLAAGAEGTLLMGNGAGAPSFLGAGTSGYMLVAAGAADPVWTAPTGTGAPVKADQPTFTTKITLPQIYGTTSGNIGFNGGTVGTSGANVLSVPSGTAPTTSPADLFQMWSADYNGAGSSRLYGRTEEGNSQPIALLSESQISYGVAWNETTDAYTRLGRTIGHKVASTLPAEMLPIQESMKRCLLADAGTVNYFLNPNDSTKKVDGSTASDLTGADGQVMVRIPKFWYRYNYISPIHYWEISPVAMSDFDPHPAFYKDGAWVDYRYIGAYEGVLYDTSVADYVDGIYQTAVSCVIDETAESFTVASRDAPFKYLTVGQKVVVSGTASNNGTFTIASTADQVFTVSEDITVGETAATTVIDVEKDYTATTGDVLSSVSGKTAINYLTRANARVIASNRGSGWRQPDYDLVSAIQLLFLTEYASFYSQSMIGDGITNVTDWPAYNDSNPIVRSGNSNVIGNATGNTAGSTTCADEVSDYISYRGIENWYGHVWKWVDGFNINGNIPYMTNNSTNWADDTATNYTRPTDVLGNSITLINANGYQNTLEQISRGFLPASVGASSSTKITDYYYQNTGWRVAALGGDAASGAAAGGFCWILNSASSYLVRNISARASF